MESPLLPDTVEYFIVQVSYKILDYFDRKTVVLTWSKVSRDTHDVRQQRGHANYNHRKYKSPAQLSRDQVRQAEYLQRRNVELMKPSTAHVIKPRSHDLGQLSTNDIVKPPSQKSKNDQPRNVSPDRDLSPTHTPEQNSGARSKTRFRSIFVGVCGIPKQKTSFG